MEAVDCYSLAQAWRMTLNYGEEELMMAEKYKGRGHEWAEYSATDKRNPVVNCGQDCFHRFNGCLLRGSLLV